jgi:hypothetical protein
MDRQNVDVMEVLDRKIQYHLAKAKYYENQKSAIQAILSEAMEDGMPPHSVAEAAPMATGKYADVSMGEALSDILNERDAAGILAPTTKDVYEALISGGFKFGRSDYKGQMGSLSTFLSRKKKAGNIIRDEEERIYFNESMAGEEAGKDE